jgi:hypothetical protein
MASDEGPEVKSFRFVWGNPIAAVGWIILIVAVLWIFRSLSSVSDKLVSLESRVEQLERSEGVPKVNP